MSSFSLPSSSPVLIGGSRSVPVPGLVSSVCHSFVKSLLAAGHTLHVGCASGADHAALRSGVRHSPQAVKAFAAFSPSGAGSFSGSAVSAIQAAAAAGVSVSFLAGGPLSVPLVARLMGRSMAALRGCGAAVFFSPGVGSLKVARAALRQGIPVLVWWQAGMPVPSLPVAPVLVQWFGLSFWLYSAPVQSVLF